MLRIRFNSSIVSLAVGFCAATFFSQAALAAGVGVPMDQVRMITFRTPFKTVYVGNPIIADITVIDSTHVFVLGKNFGTTNIVALDDGGRVIMNDQITVLGQQGTMVTLQRGPGQKTLSCDAGRCEAKPTPGDEPVPFDAVSGQIDRRDGQNLRAAVTGAAADAAG